MTLPLTHTNRLRRTLRLLVKRQWAARQAAKRAKFDHRRHHAEGRLRELRYTIRALRELEMESR
jgi:hypothetical protein